MPKHQKNTIKAYELAGGAEFWGAETDVRMTKDKKFILQHDLTFKRLCGVDKKPEDMTLSEIQKLTIKSGNNISKYKKCKISNDSCNIRRLFNNMQEVQHGTSY